MAKNDKQRLREAVQKALRLAKNDPKKAAQVIKGATESFAIPANEVQNAADVVVSNDPVPPGHCSVCRLPFKYCVCDD